MTRNPQLLILASISVLYILATLTALRNVKNMLTLGFLPETYRGLVWWIRAFLWLNLLTAALTVQSYFAHRAFRGEDWVEPAAYAVVMSGIFRSENEALHLAKKNEESDTTRTEADPL